MSNREFKNIVLPDNKTICNYYKQTFKRLFVGLDNDCDMFKERKEANKKSL